MSLSVKDEPMAPIGTASAEFTPPTPLSNTKVSSFPSTPPDLDLEAQDRKPELDSIALTAVLHPDEKPALAVDEKSKEVVPKAEDLDLAAQQTREGGSEPEDKVNGGEQQALGEDEVEVTFAVVSERTAEERFPTLDGPGYEDDVESESNTATRSRTSSTLTASPKPEHKAEDLKPRIDRKPTPKRATFCVLITSSRRSKYVITFAQQCFESRNTAHRRTYSAPSPSVKSEEAGDRNKKRKRGSLEAVSVLPTASKMYIMLNLVILLQPGLEDELDIKPDIKPEIKELKRKHKLHMERSQYPSSDRPDNAGSILDINTFSDSYFPTYPPDQPPEDLLHLKHFKRVDLGGPLQDTYVSGPTETRPMKKARMTPDPARNSGFNQPDPSTDPILGLSLPIGPGKPFWWLTGDPGKVVDTSVFVLNEKQARKTDRGPTWAYMGEKWKYFGTYRCVWLGHMTQADWNEATDAQRDAFVLAMGEYCKKPGNQATLEHWKFSPAAVNGFLEAIRSELDTKADKVGPMWALYNYCGYDREELDWVSRNREERRAGNVKPKGKVAKTGAKGVKAKGKKKKRLEEGSQVESG